MSSPTSTSTPTPTTAAPVAKPPLTIDVFRTANWAYLGGVIENAGLKLRRVNRTDESIAEILIYINKGPFPSPQILQDTVNATVANLNARNASTFIDELLGAIIEIAVKSLPPSILADYPSEREHRLCRVFHAFDRIVQHLVSVIGGVFLSGATFSVIEIYKHMDETHHHKIVPIINEDIVPILDFQRVDTLVRDITKRIKVTFYLKRYGILPPAHFELVGITPILTDHSTPTPTNVNGNLAFMTILAEAIYPVLYAPFANQLENGV